MFGFLAKLLFGTPSGPTTETPPTTTPPSPPQSPPPLHHQLPFDVLLEIAARTDPTTAVCCAATCKPLRRGIVDPSFRRRRLAILAASNNGVYDMFDPALLVGFSYRLTVMHDHCGLIDACSAHVVKTDPSPRSRPRIHPRLLEAFEPVASRDGLVVLRLDHAKTSRDRCYHVGNSSATVKFHVWDALAARATSLPSICVSADHYPLALLHVGATGRSFELLVADREMTRFNTFSSKTGRWSADRAVHVPPRPYGRVHPSTRPAVVGRTVHWLCLGSRTHLYVLALDTDAGAATTVALPPGVTVSSSMYVYEVLLACVGGRLSCLVAESSTLTVSVWTLTSAWPEPSWSRQVVVGVEEMERSAGTRFQRIRLFLHGFGERSGVVILQITDGTLVRLNLATKEATALGKYQSGLASHVCVYEIIDMASVLQALKPF